MKPAIKAPKEVIENMEESPIVQLELSHQTLNHIRPSREALKRKMEQLQSMGRVLIELPQGKFDKLTLPDALLGAVKEARRLTSKEAKRRQLQFVGSIMEQFDAADLAKQLRDIDHHQSKEKTQLDLGVKQTLLELLGLEEHEFYDRFHDKLAGSELQRFRQFLRSSKKQLSNGKSIDGIAKLYKKSDFSALS